MRRISLVSLLLSSFVFTAIVFGQSPLTIRMQPYLSGLALPVLARHAGDGTKRMFIVQQKGIIKVVQPGETATTDFMNISSKVTQGGGEQGLLGLAFHPQFATNHYFFVDYTRISDGATVIARYTAINNNTQGDPTSERILLTIPDPFSNHNGGMLEYGPDGYLYAGLGDGGSANDPGNRAQNINEFWGKFLRIAPDVSGSPTAPLYTNPPDNPYFGATAGLDEIYALGMRNPWRWSFDRGGTHQLWVADVGQNAIEEFETVVRGGNYGWRVFEGTTCTPNDPPLCTNPPTTYLPPIGQYSHSAGRCSVTGGYVYRGGQNTLPNGAYTYADYCTGEIWMWNNNAIVPLLDTTRLITSFGEDEDGELYVVGQGSGTNGTVEKIVRARSSADFDGDFKTDVSVFRPSNGAWYISNSSNGAVRIINWGLNGDIPTPEDYDADNISDIAVFRPSNGAWYVLNSSNGSFNIYNWGLNGDVPAAGDFDGDAKADPAVFRNGTWYLLNSSTGMFITQFGLNGDTPTVGDYDGDGKADIAVFRPSNGVWYSLNSTNGVLRANQWGISTDRPAPGDFDGDGKTDLNVYRVSGGTGNWYTLRSTNGTFGFNTFGNQNDVPAVGDYDGDGKDDIAVWRTTDGTWYAIRSSNSSVLIQSFGLTGDQPAPTYDAP